MEFRHRSTNLGDRIKRTAIEIARGAEAAPRSEEPFFLRKGAHAALCVYPPQDITTGRRCEPISKSTTSSSSRPFGSRGLKTKRTAVEAGLKALSQFSRPEKDTRCRRQGSLGRQS